MNVETIVVGEFQSNCFVAWNTTRQAIVIDPGADAGAITDYITKQKLKVAAYLQTHGHMDHISSLADMCKEFPAPVYIHTADERWAFTAENQWLPYYGTPRKPAGIETDMTDGAELPIPGFACKVITTPGHTPGCMCFYFAADSIIFTGDTLFAGSVGRTDLPGGDSRELKKSLEKLAKLPDTTVVYAGHGPATTIGDEKRDNFFMQQKG